MSDLKREQTVGVIAARTGEPIHKIEYIIRSRRIRPSSAAGHAMVYDEQAYERIVTELAKIKARSRGPKPEVIAASA